jgi:hypothetical protein
MPVSLSHFEILAQMDSRLRMKNRCATVNNSLSTYRGVPTNQGLAIGQENLQELPDRRTILGGAHSDGD